MKVVLVLILLILSTSHGAKVVFKKNYPFYKNADIYTVQVSESGFKTNDLCREIARQNLNISKIHCRRAGDFERSAAFMNYIQWVSKNLYTKLDAPFLKTRDDSVKTILQHHEDAYIMFVHTVESRSWVVLYHGGEHYPTALLVSSATDVREVYTDIALNFFNKQQEPKLTAEEKKIAQETPNSFYRDRIAYDLFAMYGIGYTAGLFQHDSAGLTGTQNNNGDIRYTWNWLDKGEPLADVPVLKEIKGRPLHNLQFGVQYAEFIGAAVSFRYSDYTVRYFSDTAQWHSDIEEWNFQRYEIGLNINLAKYYSPSPNIEIAPKLILGLLYSFWNSDFKRTAPQKSPPFEIGKMKGASIGVASQFLFYQQYGFQLELGTSYRGNNSEYYQSEINNDDYISKESITSAYDYYLMFSLLYVSRTFLD